MQVDAKCRIDDIEVCERGVGIISTVDEFGLGEPHMQKEIYGDESYIAYYYCNNCKEGWTADEHNNDPAEAWDKAKEHLNV